MTSTAEMFWNLNSTAALLRLLSKRRTRSLCSDLRYGNPASSLTSMAKYSETVASISSVDHASGI
jgi:hypothetical protein